MDIDQSDPTSVSVITRRQFLAVATAVAMTPLVPIGHSAVRAATRGDPLIAVMPPVPLSVGYIGGSALSPSLQGVPWADDGVPGSSQVIPAASLRAGAPDLVGRTAVIIVHGLVPDLHRIADRSLRFVALDADLHAEDPTSTLRFFAWTLRTGATTSASGRSIFRMQVTPETRLGFDLAVGRDGSNSLSSGHLGLASHDDRAVLRRGAYLLALDPQTWDRARALPDRDDPEWGDLPSLLVTVDEATS